MVIVNEQETTQQIWYGCYDGGWQDITPEAFSHPAKFAQGLVRKIFEYGLEMGYFKVGDTILDPFGGVGLGAKYALANGLSWVGVELERRFTDLGQGCDCTGISPEEWHGYKHLFEPDKIGQLNYKYGRHWCPACIAGAVQIKSDGLNDHRQPGLFDATEDSRLPTGFKLTEDGTPFSLPHHYTGNLELFRKYAKPGTFAVLLNGDSRFLRQVIGQAQRDGLLSSPPYINSLERSNGIDADKIKRPGGSNSQSVTDPRYGSTGGQLGGMSEGSLADSLVSSPPYANGEKGHPSLGSVNKDNWGQDGRDIAGRRGLDGNYGGTDGQLANMPLGDSLLSSPPFAGNTGGRGPASRNGIDAALFDRHSGGMKRGTGDDPGNLDHLPMKGFSEALVSSPPFEKSINREGEWGRSLDPQKNSYPQNRSQEYIERNLGLYGTTPGQLGTEQGQTFWAAARLIVSESYQALKPGSYSAWVCKKFVRGGKIVDFPGQWQQLCAACGFEYVETIRAMLVSPENEQKDLNGGGKKIQKQNKSFFRLLAEKKGSPRIDFEEIVILKKPTQAELFPETN